jgi:hypothetical protein
VIQNFKFFAKVRNFSFPKKEEKEKKTEKKG